MLKRLYVNGYKTLVNFDLEIENINILLGQNGVGKSSIVEVLCSLKNFLSNDGQKAENCFSRDDVTKWINTQNAFTQQFEIELENDGNIYKYSLCIEHNFSEKKTRVSSEELLYNSNKLYSYNVKTGEAILYRDNFSQGPSYMFDWSRSGIGGIFERSDNKLLINFKKSIQNIVIAKLSPSLIGSEADNETENPNYDMSNFANWYLYLTQSRQSQVFDYTLKLREIFSGFSALQFAPSGDKKILEAVFDNGTTDIKIRFDKLSDGQKTIIILYALLYCLPKKDISLILDEPENYLALPEIHFWLSALDAQVLDGLKQAFIISHHPRLINFLAKDAGLWMYRDTQNSPTRIQKISATDDTTMSIDKLVELNWITDV
ncbi:MAG: hypothetical protein RL154_1453 [Pseudomonadota bacterium]